MRSFSLILLAAAVAAVPQWGPPGLANAGADADDSWPINEIAETATLVVDRISEARKFLADLDDDTFDFGQWYDEQLADFTADQDNVGYEDPDDQANDLEDFTQQLNAISTEFASSQGEDYANFVRDIIGEGIDHLHDQGQELLNRMQETANDINDLEEQEYDLYVQLSKISCVDTNQNVVQIDEAEAGETEDELAANEEPEETNQWPPTLPGIKDFPVAGTPFQDPTGLAAKRGCKLKSVFEELREYNKKMAKAPTSTGQNKWRKKIQKALKNYRDYVRKWQKLMHTFTDLQQKEEHEKDEYDQYETLLHGSQELQEFGMEGSDSLVLPDSRITGIPGV